MIDSILTSIKKMLGIEAEYEVFDEDIMVHINTVFSTLHSIGASPEEPFIIFSAEEKWSDFLLQVKQAMMVKTYMYLKVKLIFDPPATSFALDAFKRQADEMEWRLGILEFEFNPLSRPVDSVMDTRALRELTAKLDEVESLIEDVDTEVDRVPDLSEIFHGNLDDD